MQLKLSVKGLEGLDKLSDEMLEVIKDESKKIFKDATKEQEDAILAGNDVNGGAQKQNAESTRKRKARLVAKGTMKYNLPLYRTGLLADSKKWKVSRGKQKATLKAPKERQGFMRILKAKGYGTLYDGMPRTLVEKFERRLNERLRKL